MQPSSRLLGLDGEEVLVVEALSSLPHTDEMQPEVTLISYFCVGTGRGVREGGRGWDVEGKERKKLIKG